MPAHYPSYALFRSYLLTLALLVMYIFSFGKEDSLAFRLDWKQWSSLPPAEGQSIQPGLAGAFVGLHQDVFILAGGANFPDGPAWEGGKKVYHQDIYLLKKSPQGEPAWLDPTSLSLPQPIAYGLSISLPEGLLCLGGMDGNSLHAQVRLLSWNKERKSLEITDWPDLPQAVANLSGGKIGNQIYVAASDELSQEKYFWTLDIQNISSGWQKLPSWPGSPRTHAYGVVQENSKGACFYLLKGRFRKPGGISEMLGDGFYFDPKTGSWSEVETDPTLTLAAGTGLAMGANHILLMGGDDGKLFNRLEQFALDIAQADSHTQQILIQQRDSLLLHHPGFSRDIWAFHTITESWHRIGKFASGSPVTTTALRWGNELLIPSGEIAPCIRTPHILAATVNNESRLSKLNTGILIAYFVLLAGMGLYFAQKQHSTEDFFKGGKRIPAWAAGLSIFGTQLSAITFMAIPAKTFASNWLYFFLSMTILMIYPFIIRYFLPFYRRFNLTTAYEYLELRFNLATRLLGSFMYVLFQIGRLAIVLLLPSLALSVVTGLDVSLCILAMGILSILYTALGGIEAVIWTDVLQVIVLLGGALFAIGLLFFQLETGDIVDSVSQFNKLQILDTALDFSQPTLWVVLIGGFASNLIQYGSDQTVVQRYLTTKDEKQAAQSIRLGAWMALPATLLFFSIGTLLFVLYRNQPELLSPALAKTDSIFPWFIVNSLPNGLSGLLLAAIFAASMSSLDSSMHSVSTVVTTDFFRRLRPGQKESNYLRVARWLIFVIGAVGIALALIMARWGISSLWDQFNLIVGLFAGGLGGIFLLGIFSERANGRGALAGLFISGLVQYLIRSYTDLHFIMYAFTGLASAFIAGYLISLWIGKNSPEAQAYTYSQLKDTP